MQQEGNLCAKPRLLKCYTMQPNRAQQVCDQHAEHMWIARS